MNAEPRRDDGVKIRDFDSLPASANGTAWRFSGYEFSVERGLRREKESIDLQPKVRSLLELLLRGDGAVVGKETIAAALWPAEGVSDDSIARVVSGLRKALRSAGHDMVKTRYGAGVRLDAEISTLRAAAARTDADEARDALLRNVYEVGSGRTTAGARSALRLLREFVARYPDYAEGWSLTAYAHVTLALRGSLAPAAAAERIARHAAQALGCDPRNANALAVSGWALAILAGKIEDGGRLLEVALDIAPQNPLTHLMRGWLAAEKRDLNAALGEVDNGLRHVPLDRGLTGLRARLLLCVEKIEQADAFARQSLSLRPDIDSLHYVRSAAASLRGDHRRAIVFAEHAVRISGRERVPLSFLAYALALAGRREEADKAYRAASEGFPVSSFLAPARLALGDLEGARSILRQAELSLCPWRSLMRSDPRLAPLRAGAD